jgi:flagellar FliL protein
MAREDKKPSEAPAAKPKKRLLLIIIAAVIVLAAAGGAAWYFMKGRSSGEEQKPPVASLTPIFIPLDPFTVNLQREDGDRVLQVGLSFKLYNAELPEKIKAAMPEIRSNLLLLLSSKHASELVSVDGKKKLANEIIVAVDNILGIPQAALKSAPVVSPAAAAPAPATPAPAGDGVVAEGATAPAAVPATAPAAPVVAEQPSETKSNTNTEAREGIVGVLFTSFIIQ